MRGVLDDDDAEPACEWPKVWHQPVAVLEANPPASPDRVGCELGHEVEHEGSRAIARYVEHQLVVGARAA
jgi:hypothetical protein